MRTNTLQINLRATAGKLIAFACYCVTVCQLHAQPAPLLDQKFWMADGPVNAILATNNTVYIGGDFTYVGPRTGPVALFDQATGALLASAPRINGPVKAAVADGSGGWFIGGTFTRIGTFVITNVAHLNPDLTPDPFWNARINGATVNALALDGGRLYIGGTFTRISGLTVSGGLAGVSPANAVVNWNPSLTGTVNAMQVTNGLVYVGGNFTSVGNSNFVNVAAISTNTTLATGWNPNPDAAVFALFVTPTNVYVGGAFANIGGKPRSHVAAVDLTLGVANNWHPDPNGTAQQPVRAILATSSNVFIGGDFTQIALASRTNFASIGLTGTGSALPLNLQLASIGTANLVRSILLRGNSLYVGGQFTNSLTLAARCPLLVGVSITNSLAIPVPLGTEFNGAAGAAFGINAMATANGQVLVVGDYQSIGGVSRQRAAALSIATGAALPWAPKFDGPVLCMAYGTNRIYVGGSFTNYNSTNVVSKVGNGLGAVDPVNGNPVPFNFLGTNGTSPVSINSLALSSSSLYAGGLFTVVGNQPRKNLAALDPSTGNVIIGFSASLAGGSLGVTALVLNGPNLYVGGDFTTVSNLAIPRLTVVSSVNGAPDTSWLSTANGNSPNQAVTTLSASADTLYVGGNFTQIAGLAGVNHFAAFSLADNSLLNIPAGLGSSDTVTGIGATTTAAYVGGTFITFGGENRLNLGELSPVDGSTFAWNPSPDIGPSQIVLTDDYAFLGGSFRIFGQSPTNQPNGFFAAFSRAPQMTIKKSTPGNVQIDFTTSDRTDAVLQGTTNLTSSIWTDIQAYGPGVPQSMVIPTTPPTQFFRVITH